jgi:hypothetical protein
MSFTINLTDGSIFAVIPDGTVNTNSSMTLIGKNYTGYGEFLDENFIHLLENGSNTSPPAAPLTGQLWWDKTNSLLKVYNGSTFKTISAATASASAPSNNVIGDLWYDTSNQQLKVWTGTTWLLIGPSFTAGTGITGAIVDTIVDNTLVSHVVIKLYVSNSVVGIISKDAAFTPQTSISGFAQVLPGITLATLVGAQIPLFQGTATNSQALNNLSSTSFMRTDANTSTTGTLAVLTDNGLTAGADSDFKVSVSGINVNLQNQTSGGNLNLRVNVSGTPTTIASLDGTGLNLTTPLSAANGGTGLIAPGLAGNILTSNGTAWYSNTLPSLVTSLTGTANAIAVSSSTGAVTISVPTNSNGYGVRTVSSSTPTGGSDGDIWYQI